MLFAGGPAPAANAVISTCAASFVRNGIGVLGIKYGYSRLAEYSPERPLELGRDYIDLNLSALRRTRNSQGILIGTAAKGRMVGEWPGLKSLDEDDNLRSTSDFRAVYCSLLEQWFGVDAAAVVPGASGFNRPALIG